ncbi:MAG: ATP-binding cassette domain-containing protein [Thermoproteota archaeon]|nr:ATP-binding cassette domain-containing protein [Thermoproteota archaeon]
MGKNDRDNILELVNIKKYFPIKRSFKQILRLDPPAYVKAVDDVSFQLKRGNVFVIAGESGSGKSTLARIILKAVQPDAGFIFLNGEDITITNDKKTMKKLHENVQMIQQDPYSSLNPRMRVMDIVMEPLNIHERQVSSKHERIEKVLSSLQDVRLHPADSIADQFPHMLSGGQRQRVALARALVLRPSLIIADEPVSMLDVSVRAEILQVIKSLKDRLQISCVYITHDLSTSRYIGDTIAIMYAGRIVEIGQVDKVLSRPLHPYTQALINAIPQPFSGTLRK